MGSAPLRNFPRQPANGRPIERLTDRDREIIRWVCLCPVASYRDIARQLRTTEQTLKNRLKRIYDLTGTCGRAELIWWFLLAALEAGEQVEELTEEQRQLYGLLDTGASA